VSPREARDAIARAFERVDSEASPFFDDEELAAMTKETTPERDFPLVLAGAQRRCNPRRPRDLSKRPRAQTRRAGKSRVRGPCRRREAKMRFITDKIHGVIDYAAAAALIVGPFLLGFAAPDAAAKWLSVAAGAALLVYSALTSYSLGVRRLIPFPIHLAVDFAAGAAFLAAPFALGFGEVARAYFLVMGGAVLAVVLLTRPVAAAQAPMQR
jgi:hypothetical protein